MSLRVLFLKLKRRSVFTIVAMAVTVSLFGLFLQSRRAAFEEVPHNSLHPLPEKEPPGTIDGAKNPEMISDLKAYEVFFTSVAISESASETERTQAKNKFVRAKLNEKDVAAVMKTMGEFYIRQQDIINRSNLLRKNNAHSDEFAKLRAESIDIVSSSRDRLMSRLSMDGRTKLHQHVILLKHKIKLTPVPPM